MIGLSQVIDKYLKDNNMTLREFAGKCDLSHSYVNKLRKGVNPNNNQPIEPTMDTIKRVAHAMGLTLEELLIKAEYIKDDKYTLKGDKIPLELREIGIEYITLAKEIEGEGLSPNDIRDMLEIAKRIQGKK